MKNEITKIKVSKSNAYQIGRMLENVCDKYNLHNYFGLISTSIIQAAEIAFERLQSEDKLEFSFAQCVGGMSFMLSSEAKIFADLDLSEDIVQDGEPQTPEAIIKSLTNEAYILEEGSALEMIFYVNGIEPHQLRVRQDRVKEYFLQLLVTK